MPSSPKKTQKTGSVLLGQELRRLRGGRTLREIAQLTKSAPLVNHVATVSEANLCEIESGKTMPSLPTMHALSVIYKTSMSQLMAYVVEERCIAGSVPMARDRDPEEAFGRELREREWHAALSIAIRAEHAADSEGKRIAWRANRASALALMGLHGEALTLLTECSESDALEPAHRAILLHNLAGTHFNAGNYKTAALIAREALELADQAGGSDTTLAMLALARATMTIEAESVEPRNANERRVREAMRLLDRARSGWNSGDRIGLLAIRIKQAEALYLLGNLLVAARDLCTVIEEATAIGNSSLIAQACLALATVKGAQGASTDEVEQLERALKASLATSERDATFQASFRLFLRLADERPGTATAHFRRCVELFPTVSSHTKWTRQFEAYQRSGR